MVDVSAIDPTGYYDAAQITGFGTCFLTYIIAWIFYYSWYRVVCIFAIFVATGLLLMELLSDGRVRKDAISPRDKAIAYLVGALFTITLILPPAFMLLVSILYIIDYRRRAMGYSLA